MTGDVKITGGAEQTPFHFKDTYIETTENVQLIMKHYNLIEYIDNYQDTVGPLYQFKRDEQELGAIGALIVVIKGNSSSFKYKSNLLSGLNSILTPADGNVAAYRTFKNAQILVPLKYVSSFFRTLELPLINTKLHLELSWSKNCIVSTAGTNGDNDTNTFQITKTELYAPVATLSTNDNEKLNDLLRKGFKRSVFWIEYKSKIETHTADANNLKIIT